MGINFLEEQVPDATTLLHFRRMMEESKIGEQLLGLWLEPFKNHLVVGEFNQTTASLTV
jgi:IS5 family transposase